MPSTCYEVECGAWVPRPRGAQARDTQAWGAQARDTQAWGAHTCRAVPRPTYTTPQHLRLQGEGNSSSLHSLELGDEHTTECLGGRPREGVAAAAMDFLTKYESPPRSIEIHAKLFSPTCPYF